MITEEDIIIIQTHFLDRGISEKTIISYLNMMKNIVRDRSYKITFQHNRLYLSIEKNGVVFSA